LRDQPLAYRLALEILDRPREGVRRDDLGRVLYFGSQRLLACGDRANAEKQWSELALLAERTRDASLTILSLLSHCDALFVDGKLEEAAEAHAAAQARSREWGLGTGDVSTRLRWLLGRLTSADVDSLPSEARPALGMRALMLAYVGRHDEARAVYE